MKIILKKEVAGLGEAGELVEVKSGYALNYLIPQAKIAATPVKLTAKVAESGKLYGAVTAAMVAEALVAAGIEVDKKDVTIPEIKEAGNFEGKVKVYKKIVADINVEVVAESAE